ncbi:hypothetical protein N7470_007560 [Penicillium chermesinum]|nr:hypothetical protein N7470_007560 [Penicillium chermesinum]
MAEHSNPVDESDPWNFSSPVEDQDRSAEVTSTTDASSNLLDPDVSTEPTKPDVNSPVSDDDFSAWDMSHESRQPEPQDATIDSVVEAPVGASAEAANDAQIPEETSDALPTEPAAQSASEFDDQKTLTTEASPAPSQPEPAAAEEPLVDALHATEQPDASHTDAIFTSNEEAVDFSDLLAKDPETVENVNAEEKEEAERKKEQAPTVGTPLVEAAPAEALQSEVPPMETPPVETMPIEESGKGGIPESTPQQHVPTDTSIVEAPPVGKINEPAEPSSIDAVFGNGEDHDDFSALLSKETETPNPEQGRAFSEGAKPESTPAEQLLPDSEVNGASVSPWASLDNVDAAEELDSGLASQSTHQHESNLKDEAAWGNQVNGDLDSDGDDFFNQLKTQTKPIFAPPEAESRFEEGVPLLDDDAPQSPERAVPEGDAAADPFADDNDDAEGFFSSTTKPKSTPLPSLHITRKSTSQVMEQSAGLDLASPASDASAAAAFDEALKAAPNQTETSQPQAKPGDQSDDDDMVALWGAELSDTDEEDDLMAQWGAALDDGDEAPAQAAPRSPVANGGLNSPFETPQPRQTPPQGYTWRAPPGSTNVPYYSQPPANPVTVRGESFAERSKQGYKSPYDLPDDLSKPRRPLSTPRPVPPRVDSALPPPPTAGSMQPPASAVRQAPAAPPPAPKNFFEELPPPAPRSPRPASSGRYTPGPVSAPTGSAMPPPSKSYAPTPAAAPVAPVPPVAPPVAPPVQSALQPPEVLDPYASLASSAPAGPSASARYSPKPPVLQPGSKASRYSPAPQSAGGRNRYASQPLGIPGQVNLPFQPRTSSPLAYHEKVSYQPENAGEGQQQQPPSLEPSVDLSPPRAQRSSIDHGALPPQSAARKTSYAPPEYLNEFTKRLAPNSAYQPAPPTGAVPTSPASEPQMPPPPRRSQTQSPGQQMTSPRALAPAVDHQARPVSAHAPGSPVKAANPYAPPQQPSVQTHAFSQQFEFIAPTDGQEQDPLERWKGAPIFKFGFGGSVVSCFPKHIPRYSVGQPKPMIKPTLGEPKLSKLDTWLPPVDTIVPHPGPLKSKSKKKDLLAWLSSKIAIFENEVTPDYNPLQPDLQKRHEEKILLWKISKILVENDGVLEGTPEVQKSLRQAIFPNLVEPQKDDAYSGESIIGAGAGNLGLSAQSGSTDSQWTEELRTNLILGEREKAVWSAVDRGLWGHAMILASTLERSVWKQVVQEFVRREIRSTSASNESLAALYEIFGGNIEESVDELVPPSARAGHQLISKTDGQGVTKDALAGLDSWRETLGFVLSNRSSDDRNRSSDDPQALVALGNLLASYGRIEAAHICYICSRAAVCSGADDPQANIVLLGADHQRSPASLLEDDAILLTEVYEFATTVLATAPMPPLPYFLAFKLVYAKTLADRGRKTEAQNYCDAVAAALKANTRHSPYYHNQLFVEIDELSARLRQTTSDGSSSWIPRPSMEKVSGTMWARFNSFVAGEDSDAASTTPGKGGEMADVGPFANVAGQPAPAGIHSKYHPSAQYAPSASPEQYRSRSSMDSYRSVSGSSAPFGQRRTSQESSPVEPQPFQAAPSYGSPGLGGYQPTPPQSSYMPLAPVKEDASHTSGEGIQPPVNGLFFQPPGQAQSSDSVSPFYQGPPDMPQAEDPGYLPPSIPNSYEPPSFAPDVEIDEVGPDDSPDVKVVRKKKSFMDLDDDDDLGDRAASIQKAQREENDRKAEEAFKKAAEEDAKRAAQQPAKKGWLSGWFGGKKEPDNATGNAPIRAKLGEENSFYYDNELKKWVNKKDPGSATAARATPPPPRGSAPTSRNASYGSMAPPPPLSAASGSRPPSSSSEAGFLSSSPAFSGLGVPPPLPRSVSTSAAAPTPPGSSGGPPPRPTSSLTHAQSIDDLLAAPAGRKGGSARGKKKGRYVDVMAQ